MGCLLAMGTSQPPSSSCQTRIKTQKLYYMKTDRTLVIFAFLDSSYFLLFDKLWETRWKALWTLFYLFQHSTTAKHSNVHALDFWSQVC